MFHVEHEKTVAMRPRHNYCLEVEQFERCITDGEEKYISEEFSRKNSRVVEQILKAIQY